MKLRGAPLEVPSFTAVGLRSSSSSAGRDERGDDWRQWPTALILSRWEGREPGDLEVLDAPDQGFCVHLGNVGLGGGGVVHGELDLVVGDGDAVFTLEIVVVDLAAQDGEVIFLKADFDDDAAEVVAIDGELAGFGAPDGCIGVKGAPIHVGAGVGQGDLLGGAGGKEGRDGVGGRRIHSGDRVVVVLCLFEWWSGRAVMCGLTSKPRMAQR
jgi:hypothetical protein